MTAPSARWRARRRRSPGRARRGRILDRRQRAGGHQQEHQHDRHVHGGLERPAGPGAVSAVRGADAIRIRVRQARHLIVSEASGGAPGASTLSSYSVGSGGALSTISASIPRQPEVGLLGQGDEGTSRSPTRPTQAAGRSRATPLRMTDRSACSPKSPRRQAPAAHRPIWPSRPAGAFCSPCSRAPARSALTGSPARAPRLTRSEACRRALGARRTRTIGTRRLGHCSAEPPNPLPPENPRPPVTQPSQTGPTMSNRQGTRGSVLVVDDEPVISDVVSRVPRAQPVTATGSRRRSRGPPAGSGRCSRPGRPRPVAPRPRRSRGHARTARNNRPG